ncbi:centromere protein R isoform X1 [Triplophysa rosa]|nr:centromere protein R isoform X1 [Triplophysa rosa]
MPVKRALQLHDKENSPAKRHAPNKNYSPMTGTRLMSPATKPAAGTSKADGKKTNTPKTKKPMTDAERIVFLRSKVRRSVKDIMKYRHQLETLMPVEGSSELRSLLLMGPADLQTELKRHEDLSSKVASSAHRPNTNKGHVRGLKQTSSSYEFLKAILSR